MTKHVLTYAFFLIFTHFAAAQLTLQQVDEAKEHVIPAGADIDLTFPTKTSGLPQKAFRVYGGQLKNVSNTGINIVQNFENHYFINENGVTIQQYRNIRPADTPMIVQIPFTKMRSITQNYPKIRKLNNAGAYLMLAALVSNIFIAPHLKAPQSKMVRNAGFIAMGVGLSIGLIPNKKTYYLEQPINGNKKLWQIAVN